MIAEPALCFEDACEQSIEGGRAFLIFFNKRLVEALADGIRKTVGSHSERGKEPLRVDQDAGIIVQNGKNPFMGHGVAWGSSRIHCPVDEWKEPQIAVGKLAEKKQADHDHQKKATNGIEAGDVARPHRHGRKPADDHHVKEHLKRRASILQIKRGSKRSRGKNDTAPQKPFRTQAAMPWRHHGECFRGLFFEAMTLHGDASRGGK
ncbi:MAG TPA: hypothetical protein VNQ90_03585 [Chthoniobacteraceae bacterium]|nr:hypothetical protein [Chthoniobacteraceae bacterium]